MKTDLERILTMLEMRDLLTNQSAFIEEAVNACRTIAKQRDEAYEQTDRLLKVTEGWRELATKLQRDVDHLKAQQALPPTCKCCNRLIGDVCSRCA